MLVRRFEQQHVHVMGCCFHLEDLEAMSEPFALEGAPAAAVDAPAAWKAGGKAAGARGSASGAGAAD